MSCVAAFSKFHFHRQFTATQVWFTLKDTGRIQVFDAKPPFAVLKTLNGGSITNHVNFVRTPRGSSLT